MQESKRPRPTGGGGGWLVALLLAATWALAWPAHAAPGGLPTNVAHTDSSPEWENLRQRLFESRRVASTPIPARCS